MADIPTLNSQFGIRQWDEQLRLTGPFWRDDRKPEKPPAYDARQRPLLPQSGTPITSEKPEEKSNIDPRRDSRTAGKLPGTKQHAPPGRLKTAPGKKRKQPSFTGLVRISRKFLDP